MALYLSNLEAAGIILGIAVMLASGFLLTRITKRLHLPNVTGYIIAGVIIGPWCPNPVPSQYMEQMDFVANLALAPITFGVGRYFEPSTLKANGKNMVILTPFESLMAGVFIMVSMLFLGLFLPFSPLLGAIGYTITPAPIIMIICRYKAKGPFIGTILQMIALDDAVALTVFSVCAAFVQVNSGTGAVSISQVVIPALLNIAALVMGAVSEIVLSQMTNERRSKDHSLVLACITTIGVVGAYSSMNVPPLLACMVSDAAYISASGNKHLPKQLSQFAPSLLVALFVLSGMWLSIPSLTAAGTTGVIYFLVRIVGKYAGSTIGAAVIHALPEARRYSGLAPIPQAGASINLTVLGWEMLPVESGLMLFTIVLPSGLPRGTVGLACSKTAIKLSGSIPDKEKCTKKGKGGDGGEVGETIPVQAGYVMA